MSSSLIVSRAGTAVASRHRREAVRSATAPPSTLYLRSLGIRERLAEVLLMQAIDAVSAVDWRSYRSTSRILTAEGYVRGVACTVSILRRRPRSRQNASFATVFGEPVDRRLEDVRRRSTALGEPDPPVVAYHDRQLVLHAGQRQAELAVGVGVHRPAGEARRSAGPALSRRATRRRRRRAGGTVPGSTTLTAPAVSPPSCSSNPNVVPDADAELARKHLARRPLGSSPPKNAATASAPNAAIERQRL